MQQPVSANPTHLTRAVRPATFAVTLLLGAALAGCGPTPGENGDARRGPAKPFAGVALAVRCPDARLAGLLAPMAKVWAARTGATVDVVAAPMTPGDATDVGVLPYREFGAWADRGDLAPAPTVLRDSGHPYQWTAVLGVYRGEQYAGWGGPLYGLPLAADGHVVIYRADRFADPQASAAFRTQFGRPLAAPATWEDFADAAGFFAARDKRPSLPALAADPARLTELFSRVAACYDRPAEGDAAPPAGGGPARSETSGFQFRLDDGKPRLDAPGFRAAAAWLAGLTARGSLPADGPADPVAALADGRAVLAVLSLDELTRLRQGGRVPDRYGVAALPGTRTFIDPRTGAMAASTGNYVPHIAGGWVGVVRTGCKTPDAAFDLLAELGGPARSLELVAAGGYGPTRDTHLDRERLQIWLGYGFDAARSAALQDAAAAYVRKTARNPTYGLRTPDQAALTAALGDELRRVAGGEVKPDDGLKRAAAAWEQANAGTPPAKVLEWRRRAAGLN